MRRLMRRGERRRGGEKQRRWRWKPWPWGCFDGGASALLLRRRRVVVVFLSVGSDMSFVLAHNKRPVSAVCWLQAGPGRPAGLLDPSANTVFVACSELSLFFFLPVLNRHGAAI